MNILYINHPEADFGGAFLYHGLCQLHGPENVYDYPHKVSYHGATHYYSTSAIGNGMTAPFPWMPANPMLDWDTPFDENQVCDNGAMDDEVRQKLREGFFELIVIESPRESAMSHWNKVRDAAAGHTVVVHEGEDYPEVGLSLIDAIKPELYLKREFVPGTPNTYGTARIIPFPFSFPNVREIPVVDNPPLDVAMSCGNTWGLRQEIAEAFNANGRDLNKHIGLNPDKGGGIQNNEPLLPWFDYLAKMATARMAVSARGFGFDTCRYWEVPHCTVMLCDNVDIQIPNGFTHKENCLKYDNAQHCVDLVRLWKDRHDELAEIRAAGKAHALANHTTEARARYLMETLG